MQKKLIFVDQKKGTAKVSGNAYDLLSLSNGRRTGTLNNENKLDCSAFKEGDEVLVTFDLSLNYKNEFVVIPTAIAKAK